MALPLFWRSKWSWLALALVLLAALAFFGVFPSVVAWRLDQRSAIPLQPLNAQSQALHSRLLVVDLHAASLLWSRNRIVPSISGHVDLARLVDGNVALQVLAAATTLPWSRAEQSGATYDLMTPLAVAQFWPVSTWTSGLQRALYQAELLKVDVRRAGSGLIAIRGKADMDRLLLARAQAQTNGVTPPVGVMLAVEGSQLIDGDLTRLDQLFDAGFRMAAPPAEAVAAAGASLTPLGKQWLGVMEQKGMLVDLARASPAVFGAIVAEARDPLVVSHAGLRAICDHPGNLEDDQVRAIAATGGLIGIAFGGAAVCGDSIDAIVKAIRHVVALVGIDHVAFGTNFDGGDMAPIDAAGLARLTHGLTAAGFADGDIAKVSGGNAWRLLRRMLPD